MSNFFEQELRKLFADGSVIHDPVFVGRACLGGLDRNRQVRAEFVTLGHADHYAALRLTLLDSNQGVVDKLTLRFKDVWGNPNVPHVAGTVSGIQAEGSQTEDPVFCHPGFRWAGQGGRCGHASHRAGASQSYF